MIHFNPQPRVEIRRNATPDYIFEWLMEKVHIHKKDWFRTSAVMLMEDSPLRKKLFEMMEAHGDEDIHARLDRLEMEAWSSLADKTSNPTLQGAYTAHADSIFAFSILSPQEYRLPKIDRDYYGNDFRRAMMNNRGISTNS